MVRLLVFNFCVLPVHKKKLHMGGGGGEITLHKHYYAVIIINTDASQSYNKCLLCGHFPY
jgi:hypothetical protein